MNERVFCHYCGNSAPPDAVFCAHCGYPINITEKEGKTTNELSDKPIPNQPKPVSAIGNSFIVTQQAISGLHSPRNLTLHIKDNNRFRKYAPSSRTILILAIILIIIAIVVIIIAWLAKSSISINPSFWQFISIIFSLWGILLSIFATSAEARIAKLKKKKKKKL